MFPDRAVDDLERQALSALARLQPLLIKRGEQGLIRRGHGDLHLRNIAVLNGEPVAFDALEFDPVIASGDLLYDLAFLLMDLVACDCETAANQLLNGYFSAVRRTADCDGIAALPFFMSLRAAIRAMTTASRLDVTLKTDAQSARRYFDLAISLLAPAKPIILGIGGLSGTGKSLLAKSLAPSVAPVPGALVFRSDVERKALYGVAEDEHLPPAAYRPEASQNHQYCGTLQAAAAQIRERLVCADERIRDGLSPDSGLRDDPEKLLPSYALSNARIAVARYLPSDVVCPRAYQLDLDQSR